ncbi:MAG: hypothetical protein DMG07_27960 [Acidobacteria bacterium]|nr:MAG: hypothetical protein DMG07_27960 [Acidobacteriota bacterium]
MSRATRRSPIALCGIGCRFPGGSSPAEFWRALRQGAGAVGEVPLERWDFEEFYDPSSAEPGKTSSKWGGFLAQIDRFDAPFFGISPGSRLGSPRARRHRGRASARDAGGRVRRDRQPGVRGGRLRQARVGQRLRRHG